MSLDLDADILITEEAPITSLIQRMGRCNRHWKENRLGTVYIYKPEDQKPYKQEDLAGLQAFLETINGLIISQSLVENLLDKFGQQDRELEKFNAFVESGPWAMAREESLRDENDFTIPAILTCDIQKFKEKRNKNEPVDGFFVSVPKRFALPNPNLNRWPLAADSNHYNKRLGFLDKPLEATQ